MNQSHSRALRIALILIGGSMLMSSSAPKPRGLRNNNPGNLRGSNAFTWQGEIGRDSGGFVIFDNPQNGLRALARILQTYRSSYGLNTIEGVLNRYAPPSENDTESYISHAENALGVSRHTPLTESNYVALMDVIVAHENGEQPYSTAQLKEGYQRALIG